MTPSSTADRILLLLKSRGPMPTAALAASLHTTTEAVRQQVHKLLEAGLVRGTVESSSGVGRPSQAWTLSASGHARFPDRHAELTRALIDTVREVFSEAGLEQLIARREDTARSAYLAACRDLPELEPRLRKLAALRDEEGYMARLEPDGTDWLLIEDHCPICAAAEACQGFCRSELEVFREVAGPAGRLRREEHLIAGARRCVYRITPVAEAAPKMRDTAV
ncbi:helix-turn-helix transcriptional regulator [Variovorax saccharolyticus]|uniref:helix-turn-helix transcriptional regulator n=1 Tax=Variovorax saccharolyticus TaxID=3053516 RepID=UPI002574BCC8|nr:HTH domain-containing protein [Variovorax sp. J31P216]MDM0027875.1 HTH domain-containing protein [Variovorax sp. J31P216]